MENMVNKQVSILIGYATAHCAIGTTGIYGRVSKESEKAVEITAHNSDFSKSYTAWFPKKALKVWSERDGYTHLELAKWFRPQGWTARFMEITTRSGSVTA